MTERFKALVALMLKSEINFTIQQTFDGYFLASTDENKNVIWEIIDDDPMVFYDTDLKPYRFREIESYVAQASRAEYVYARGKDK